MIQTREKHVVVFHCPGTFVDETSEQEVKSWDLKEAIALNENIVARYGAKPYGFRFMTLRVADPVDDGHGGTMKVEDKVIAKSSFHFLGGKVETYPEVLARNDKEENTLRFNMRCNKFWTVIINTNSYKTTRPFENDDVVVNAAGEIVDRASNYTAEWPEE